VRTRLILAQSPAFGHQDLAQNSTATLETKALRSLFRRRARQVAIPTPQGDLFFELPPAPKRLPTGIECEIDARVSKLSPDFKAQLRDLALAPPGDGQASLPVSLPSSVAASRDELSAEGTILLLKGMDRRMTMRLGARVEFDWATGTAKDLSLLYVAAVDVRESM
jgi:hypothetical protein